MSAGLSQQDRRDGSNSEPTGDELTEVVPAVTAFTGGKHMIRTMGSGAITRPALLTGTHKGLAHSARIAPHLEREDGMGRH